MKRFAWLLCLALALAALACAPKATEADCQAACEKQVNLQTPAAPAQPVDEAAKVEDEFAKKIDDAMKAKEDALKVLDDELAAKLAAAAKDEDKAALNTDFAARRAAKEAELNPSIDELAKQKEAAIEAVGVAREKAQAEAASKHADAVKGCATACLQAETKKPSTDCRQNAMSLDEFNACK
ncbi:MAG TPA: hypothetical protein PK668_11500 [Myxococcota bacterium]|nr:hypothetical protein [Myxococcota bacterium]HRY93208.1 hypothetical protein [Myxococcota bacterium]HSA22294.1 hypothetical protein [Myxococcota bacterium]